MNYILNTTTPITEEHISYIKNTTPAYPNFYGNLLPEGIKYLVTKTLSFDRDKDTIVWDNKIDLNGQAEADVTETAQEVRAEGNPNETELNEGLKTAGDPGGYDIREVAGRIRMYQDVKGHYQFIDGRTKSRMMKNLGYKEIPVDIYEIKNPKSGNLDMSLVRKFGAICNRSKYSAGILSKPDIEMIIKQDIREEYLTLHTPLVDMYSSNHALIMDYAKSMGGSTMQKKTYQKIAVNVLSSNPSNGSTKDIRLQYTEAKALAKLEQMKIYQDNYRNNGIYYHLCSASTVAKSFINAARKAYFLDKSARDPHNMKVTKFVELRVVFHSGEIHSSDFVLSASQIIDKGRTQWQEIKSAVSSAFYHNADSSSKVVLYGCLPFSKSLGYDLNKIVPFTKQYEPESLSLISKHEEPIYFSDLSRKPEDDNEDEDETDVDVDTSNINNEVTLVASV